MRQQMLAAQGKVEPDLVLKNAHVVDVLNLEIYTADIAIFEGKIVGVGEYSGHKEIDLTGQYVSPGFIDAHVHIESSLVTPREFAKVVVPHGVTSVVTDPHEIANVMGTQGLDYMLADSEGLPLDVFFMLPSCVPCTPFENSGAVLEASDLERYYTHPRVLGLAEVMDSSSVCLGVDSMVSKLDQAHRYEKRIDGHAAGADNTVLNVYATAGIKTDHECITASEAKERLRRGMYLMIREGSVAKNLDALLPAVTSANARRCMFVTDDNHLAELLEHGSVDYIVNLAIAKGMDPLQAIQLVTLNPAECFGLSKGAVAPGFDADLVIFDNLRNIQPRMVVKNGVVVYEEGRLVTEVPRSEDIGNSIVLNELTPADFAIHLTSEDSINTETKANIIGYVEGSLVTQHLVRAVQVHDGLFMPSAKESQAKVAVIERHKGTGNIGLGIVEGLKLTHGAIATTIAHDSHNVVVLGMDDPDMALAANYLKEIGGGMVAVQNGEILAFVELPIAGLMSHFPYEKTLSDIDCFNSTLNALGVANGSDTMLALSFLALPVIPALKITDTGLFDVVNNKHINIKYN